MARYVLRHTTPDGLEYWRSAEATDQIRVWPVYDHETGITSYRAQDSLRHTWEMTGPEHQDALSQGIARDTIHERMPWRHEG